MRVLPRAGGITVGIEVFDHPEIEACRWRQTLQRADDREAGALVAVDAPDDEHRPGCVQVADHVRADRPSPGRVTDHDRMARGEERGRDARDRR